MIASKGVDSVCGSVTSLVSRLPPFDFVEHEGKRYLNVKSSATIIARYTKNP